MAASDNKGHLRAAVIGAGGYVGGELLRYLLGNDAIGEINACSDSRARMPVAQAHPFLRGKTEMSFIKEDELGPGADVVFFATPPKVAASAAGHHLDAGSTVIDCSPDFRLRDLDVWSEWYGITHPHPKLAGQAVYGLVEHNREELAGAKLIAAPGCYATTLALASVPIAKEIGKLGEAKVLRLFAAASSGTSGAGRKTDNSGLLLAEAGGNYSAYSLAGHRHVPEVQQAIKKHAGVTAELNFIPHLLPVSRGMFATIHVPEADGCDLDAALRGCYAKEPLVSVLEPGRSPQLSEVTGTSRCVLGTSPEQRTVLCAIDNLGKGAAGQAVQAMNVALGLEETLGLEA